MKKLCCDCWPPLVAMGWVAKGWLGPVLGLGLVLGLVLGLGLDNPKSNLKTLQTQVFLVFRVRVVVRASFRLVLGLGSV